MAVVVGVMVELSDFLEQASKIPAKKIEETAINFNFIKIYKIVRNIKLFVDYYLNIDFILIFSVC